MNSGQSLLQQAIWLATKAHYAQEDKSGNPYILHPLRVMQAIGTEVLTSGFSREEEMAAAVLHDVVEDSKYSLADMTAQFGTKVAVVVDCLSRRTLEKESYESYLDRVAENPLAVKVKLADLRDNLGRLGNLSEADQARLRPKYEAAIKRLSPEPYCPCCLSTDVTLERNEIARWVQCHNPKCGGTHHAATNPEMERFFEAGSTHPEMPPAKAIVDQIMRLLVAALKMRELPRAADDLPLLRPAMEMAVSEVLGAASVQQEPLRTSIDKAAQEILQLLKDLVPDDSSPAEIVEIISRHITSAAPQTQGREPDWPTFDTESSDFTDGWNQAIDLCVKAFAKWQARTQPAPLLCPNCGRDLNKPPFFTGLPEATKKEE